MTDLPCLFQVEAGAIWGQRLRLGPTCQPHTRFINILADLGKYLWPPKKKLLSNIEVGDTPVLNEVSITTILNIGFS